MPDCKWFWRLPGCQVVCWDKQLVVRNQPIFHRGLFSPLVPPRSQSQRKLFHILISALKTAEWPLFLDFMENDGGLRQSSPTQSLWIIIYLLPPVEVTFKRHVSHLNNIDPCFNRMNDQNSCSDEWLRHLRFSVYFLNPPVFLQLSLGSAAYYPLYFCLYFDL